MQMAKAIQNIRKILVHSSKKHVFLTNPQNIAKNTRDTGAGGGGVTPPRVCKNVHFVIQKVVLAHIWGSEAAIS